MDILTTRKDIESLLNFKHQIVSLDYSTATNKLEVELNTKIGDKTVKLKASGKSIREVCDALNFQNQTVCESVNTTRIFKTLQ